MTVQFTRSTLPASNGHGPESCFPTPNTRSYGHAGFNIDWGIGAQRHAGPPRATATPSCRSTATTQMWDTPSCLNKPHHPGRSPGDHGQPLLRQHGLRKPYNRFLVGTVWVDSNGNDQYDPGEGIGGVTVEPDQGTYYAVARQQRRLCHPHHRGRHLRGHVFRLLDRNPLTRTVTVGSTSVLLDLKYAGRQHRAQSPTPAQPPPSAARVESVHPAGSVRREAG